MSASEFIPDRGGLAGLREAAAGCRGCHLHEHATQTVFGEGPRKATIVLVGEMAGDREDREGRPFVGPAGRELDRALEEAGIARRDVYVTNVVKHFRFEERGKRRIHQTPRKGEIDACMPWLDTEIELVEPRILACLGAVAAQALVGRTFRVSVDRGRFLDSTLAPLVSATVHPSSILRARGDAARRDAFGAFVADLEQVAAALSGAG